MYNKSGNEKACMTCANWAGPRSVNNAKFVVVENPDTRGKCNAGVFSSVTSGHCAMQGGSCPKYQQWAACKK